jgi:cell division protein FtsB
MAGVQGSGGRRRNATHMASAHASTARSRPIAATSPVARVRWDRLGRVAMLCLLVALAYLYLSAGIRIFSTWHQARSDSAQLTTLEREHTVLQHQHEALGRRGTVEEEARRLGMMHAGEQPYVLSNLPNN